VYSSYHFLKALLFCGCVLFPLLSSAQSRTPLQVTNQSPFVQLFGMPAAESATVLQSGQESSHISFNWANNYTTGNNPTEAILLDGESARLDIRWRYGFDLWEFGIDVNYSRLSGGSLDSFIENWHDWFGLPNGGREDVSQNQLQYLYLRNGMPLTNITESHSGFGDTRFTGAYQLENIGRFTLALRGGIKIPTGKREHFLSSDGVDANLSLVVGDDLSLQRYRASYFFTLGSLWTADGEILPQYRQNSAVYYNAGLIKDVYDKWQLKVQIDGHTKLYESNLNQLGDAMQLSIGGSYQLNRDLKLDFAVVEDVITDSSSDVNFHIGLYNFF
jgi:hypothetical protein